MTAAPVTIILPNFNGRRLLEVYLPSVLSAARMAGAEVIVADDASTDDSREWLSNHAPEATVLASEQNLGFARNCNRALAAASGAIAVLLNTDVEVDPEFIAPLLRHFENAADLFAVSPRILNQAKGGRDEAVNYFYFQRGLLHCHYPCLSGAAPPAQAVPIGYASGGAAAVDRAKFLELGGFDPLFEPFYWEDIDLCYRAWKRGWRVLWEPQSRVRHQQQGTISRLASAPELRRIKAERQIWFNWKNLADPGLLLQHLALWPARLLFYALKQDRRPELMAMLKAPARLGACLRSRRPNFARLTDREVLERSRPLLAPSAKAREISPDPIRTRAWRRFRDQGLAGVGAAVRRRLAYEFKRAALLRRGREGPARIAAHRGLPLDPDQVRRIAFIKLWGLGDMVMATPALSMLKSRFPRVRLLLAGSPAAARVLEGTAIFDEQVVIPSLVHQLKTPLLYEALLQVQRFQPDLVFLSYPVFCRPLGEVMDRIGARWIVGAEGDSLPRAMTATVPAPPDRHHVLKNGDLARAAGCEGPLPALQLWLNSEERAAAQAWLDRQAPGRPRICFHVGSTPGLWQKMWPAECFVELGRRLARNWGATLVLLQGPDEGPLVQEVAGRLPRPWAVAGAELSLRQTMALVEQMDVVVAGSAVWTHVAAAVATPSVCLAGPTPPSYHPWGDPAIHRCLVSPAACVPCWEPGLPIACPDAHCMRELTVDRVEAEVNELLGRTLDSRGGSRGRL